MKTAIKAVLDTAICLGFLALLEPKLGPLSIHEWGGLAICVLFLAHKLLNWSWIKSVSTKFFPRTLPARVRLNYVLDLLLFLGFSTIVLSGMAIAKNIDFSWLFPERRGLHLARPPRLRFLPHPGCRRPPHRLALELDRRALRVVRRTCKGGPRCGIREKPEMPSSPSFSLSPDTPAFSPSSPHWSDSVDLVKKRRFLRQA